MSVTWFEDEFSTTALTPGEGGTPFGSLYSAMVTGTVGIYDIVYRAAVWGALAFLIIAIIQFFNSTRGPHRDMAKGKIMREIGIFFALSGVLAIVSVILKFTAGVGGSAPATAGF